jgi:murein DD-endopeptidase MepM/ murein hydrolase activator NlpD
MIRRIPTLRFPSLHVLGMTTAFAALTACTGGAPGGKLDWDFRSGSSTLDTTGAAQAAAAARPAPDGRGVISYPGYQVAVARRGDTVASVASRVGLGAEELARYNALTTGDTLRDGEVLALPRRVAEQGGMMASGTAAPGAGSVIGSGTVAPVDVSSIATTALNRVQSGTAAAPAAAPVAPAGNEPVRHQVRRGETAFSIARTYNVSARSLADWNGLGPDLAVREGQYLIIPTASGTPPLQKTEVVTAPGAGSPTPPPPSAAKPLPVEKTAPAAAPAKNAPASPDLSASRTAASASQFAMPVDGKIIRGYTKKKNEGIDIAAAAGTPVRAAADGTVAAITMDTEQTPILVLRHADSLLTVYAGVAGITVKKGDAVKRGQTIATVRSGSPSFLHFEVRRGVESTDPMPFLQ